MLKQLVDLLIAGVLIVLLSPVLLVLAILIKFGSKGPVIYKQIRVGKDGADFSIFKFRTMYTGSDKAGLLTIGGRDPRVTPIGYTIRKYKLDELPQLFNVLNGSMSLVGPRPEVRRYTDLYTADQLRVLSVRPGITDYASIEYADESNLLAQSADPEKTYIEEVMPAKLALNMKYINEQGLFTDLRILGLTVRKIILGR